MLDARRGYGRRAYVTKSVTVEVELEFRGVAQHRIAPGILYSM